MPVRQILFHRLAASEYRAAREWYRARSPETAAIFRAAVNRAVNRLATSPEMLPVLSGSYRLARVGRFPYVLVFRQLSPNRTMIMAVAHTSRRPGYWRKRK